MALLESLFSILGLAAGAASLVFLFITFREGPEALKGAIFQLAFGIFLMTAAFMWDIILKTEPLGVVLPLDLHHFLMAISIIFFVNAARKLYHFGR